MKNFIKFLCIAIAVLFFQVLVYGEYVQEPGGLWLIDLPEGFILREASSDGKRFLFSSSVVPLDVIALVSEKTENSSGELKSILKSLGNTGTETEVFEWDGFECCFGNLYFPVNPGTADKSYYKGAGLTVPLEGKKGFFTVLAYCESYWADDYNDFMYSILDSVCVKDKHLVYPGPLTTKEFPMDSYYDVKINIKGKDLSFKMPVKSAEANQSVIEREFRLLETYGSSPLLYSAWERYYRFIYKDAFSRISDGAFVIGNLFRFEKGSILSDYEFSQKLLAFIQEFEYLRGVTSSDFINIPESLCKMKGDCDTRCILFLAILHQNNIDGIMMLSKEFSHSLVAVDVQGTGARFPFNGKKYLVGETTVKVDLGLIDSEQSEITAWKGISFPGML